MYKAYLAEGSSPLARGLLAVLVLVSREERIIPARAGFTQHEQDRRGHEEDHPRSRGVYSLTPETTAEEVGSSPLARGLHYETMTDAEQARIIPARAGFTSSR